jgi:uncharacterized membrane protein YhaH (DUF805 family)
MAIMFEPLRKYATFRGRARRLEYWSFQLFLIAASGALILWFFSAMPGMTSPAMIEDLDQLSGGGLAALWAIALFSLAMFLPSLAVSVRRLHDSDKSGWWLLLGLIPAGGLVLFIFYLLDGTSGPNRHGPDPKGRSAPSHS